MRRKPTQLEMDADYRAFFNLSLDMLCIAGFDGYFKILSPAWERRLGYTRDELLAQPYLEFVHPEDRERTIAEASKLNEGELTVSFDNRYRAKDGTYRWLHWTAAPETGSERIYAVAHDVTELKEVQHALAQAKEAAEAANRAKSDFLASMSHELRTPLNSVIGFSQVLLAKEDLDLDAQERVYLERIQANGRHLLTLINQVLDLEKVEAGKSEVRFEAVELSQLVGECAALFEPQLAEKPVELVVDIARGVAPIRTDYHKLSRVVMNLIANAVKFTEKGKITVRVIADPDGGPAAIEVIDTGIGIPEDKLETIFERFEQIETGTARSFQGSGLGLAISRALCDLLGFELTVESRLGVGSTFRVDLHPLTLDVRPEHAARDSSAIALRIVRELERERQAPQFEDTVVLVIDDEKDSRFLLTQCFEQLGCQVLTAASGPQGIKLAEEHSPDLITLDLLMPMTNGGQVLRLLWGDSRLAKIPVVVISTVGSESRAGLPEDVDIIDKPISVAEVERALKRNLVPPLGTILLVATATDERMDPGAVLTGKAVNRVQRVGNTGEALELAERTQPDLAVIELDYGEMGGEELAAELRARPGLAELPVVFFSGRNLSAHELAELARKGVPTLTRSARFAGDLRELCWEIAPGRAVADPTKAE